MFSHIFRIDLALILIMLISLTTMSHGQQSEMAEAINGLKLRGIGPALMGGRIADIAIHPKQPNTWYVAAGSGNLWKTTNRGITWDPIFDQQASYSIGTLCIDPNNPSVVYVGTGENVSGRHVGWGDGIYKSENGGKSWTNIGMKQSEHIGKILVDPRNSNILFVAAEGPLWSSGGERGVYKSNDGGNSWELVLEIDKNTGATDLEFMPGNPDVIYAAAYQRQRQVWSLMGGGPNSGIYKSSDQGDTWKRMETGLPKGDMGKIGLAVTPANPSLVYATIEAKQSEKGFYRSMDQGESWEKRNSYISGGTGPHYYQEIEASPTDPNLVYQMDVFIHVTRDGGKTFDYLGTGREKHSDNHALWIDPMDGNHLIAGTDAGLYESFDDGAHWRHFPNMPISQFYKLALDNTEPFYNIVGGAQDLGTLIGPSRTMNVEGIRNQDWYVPLGADGYDCAFDPADPNIVYMEIQQGVLVRHDRKSEEGVSIKPQPAPNDPPERWNWDSPLLISPHDNHRLYFGSQRLWRSDDRGDSWTTVSGDLTTNTNRYELELMDRVWSVDDLYDNGAMSKYATLTSIAESPLLKGLLYTGSDDGIIQVSENGGERWSKAGSLPNVPERSFINDIEASQHDANTVFAVADAHKFGNYSPLIFMSTDRGKSWNSINGDLPDGNIIWVVKQDHIDENLLFAGTEWGLYFSYNKGQNWIRIPGSPTIPFRDVELHTRDHDVVGATFGRGFYILDDYSSLRDLASVVDNQVNVLFPVRDSWWYVPNEPMQAKGMPTLGSTSFVADNPEEGALLTYFIADFPKSTADIRKDAEKKLRTANENTPFPGYELLRLEQLESSPQALILIKNPDGIPVRWLQGKSHKGINRINWDLRWASPYPVSLTKPAFTPPWAGEPKGPYVIPGNYTAELFIEHKGEMIAQGSSQSFEVKPVPSLPDDIDFQAISDFNAKTLMLMRESSSMGGQLSEIGDQLTHIQATLSQTPMANASHYKTLSELRKELSDISLKLYGDPIQRMLSESSIPSINSRIQAASGHWNTRTGPTETHKKSLELASDGFQHLQGQVENFFESLRSFEEELESIGTPYTKGRG